MQGQYVVHSVTDIGTSLTKLSKELLKTKLITSSKSGLTVPGVLKLPKIMKCICHTIVECCTRPQDSRKSNWINSNQPQRSQTLETFFQKKSFPTKIFVHRGQITFWFRFVDKQIKAAEFRLDENNSIFQKFQLRGPIPRQPKKS